MGSLYTQHFARTKPNRLGGRRFELTYHGALASVPPPSTRPLTAALIKGLLSSISSHAGRDVNIVNASLIARERGIAIDEKFVRDDNSPTSGSSGSGEGGQVTLRSYLTSSSKDPSEEEQEQIIEGHVTGGGSDVFISKLDRFAGANFQPEGTLLVLRNYDRPGKIGGVGMVVGRHGINIRFMQVAGLSGGGGGGGGGMKRRVRPVGTVERRGGEETEEVTDVKEEEDSREALMILGVEGDVTEEVVRELEGQEGILDVSLVRL